MLRDGSSLILFTAPVVFPGTTSVGTCRGAWVLSFPGGAGTSGILDSCDTGGSVSIWIIPIEHYPQLHPDEQPASSLG